MSAIAMRDEMAGGERVYFETLDGDALMARSRSQLATKFLENPELKDADVMVILDDDVQFSPEDLWKIVRGAREKKEPYGGIYVTRSRKPHPAALRWPEQTITFQAEAEPVNIRYLATGFMAIPRACMEAILKKGRAEGFETNRERVYLDYCEQGVGDFPMWDLFSEFKIDERWTLARHGYEVPGERRVHFLSEDWAFCERARQAGFDVWADPTIFLQHRCYVSATVFDLNEEGFLLSEKAAPGKGSSVIVTGEAGSDAGLQVSKA